MRNIKRLLLFITVVSILLLVFSGCRKEKITRWRCVPYEGCLIEISVDNERDLVYVTADYRSAPQNYYFLLYDNSIYRKTGNTLHYLDPTTFTTDIPRFVISSQSEETMVIIAYSFIQHYDIWSHYVTDYHFIRVS